MVEEGSLDALRIERGSQEKINLPSDSEFRLYLGELTAGELLIAKAAYRYAISTQTDKVIK